MPIDLKMPALSPTMEKGTVAKWLVNIGDRVSVGDMLAEIETDKATMELEALDDGIVIELLITEGSDNVAVGTVIARLGEAGEVTAASTPKPVIDAEAIPQGLSVADSDLLVDPHPELVLDEPPSPRPDPVERALVKSSPLARRIAAARGMDLATITGSGAGGRIVKSDLGVQRSPSAPKPTGAPIAPIGYVSRIYPPPANVPYERLRLTNMRKTIARRLTESKQTVPHFYLSIDCGIDALVALRSELNASFADRGVKLSLNDLLIKAMGLALTEVPEANVQFAGDEIYRFERADISMAVAIDSGLITPIITDAANKRLSTIAAESKALAEQARAGSLRPEQYQGGTASISNLGMFGIERIFPVINPPQAVILGVGSAQQRIRAVDGRAEAEAMLTATASFDHRAIDGAVAARFMAAYRRLLEQPLTMIG